MIITCPSCSARYKIKDGAVTAKGKKVKCKKCDTAFKAMADGSTSILAPSPATPAAPEAAKPAPQPPVQADQNLSGGATVHVDRSKLDEFLKQSGTESAPQADPAGTMQVSAEQMKKFQDTVNQVQPSAGATVQIDRSQIDAFMNNQDNIESGATVQVDRGQLDKFLQDGPPPESSPKESQEALDLNNLREKLEKGDQEGFDEDSTIAISNQPRVNPFEGAAGAANTAGEDDPWSDNAPPEPSFPSDEELGISSPSVDADFNNGDFSVDFEDQADAGPAASGPPPKPDDLFGDMAMTAPDTPPPAPPTETRNLFTARVDGNEYPNLDKDALERWIKEGRLLENDQVSINGGPFTRADQVPELQPLFDQYFGGSQSMAEAESEPKKGFLAKLLSIFKK